MCRKDNFKPATQPLRRDFTSNLCVFKRTPEGLKSKRVMEALLKMKDIAGLQKAYARH